MKIRKIKIHNVKGISEYCVDALLLPNRPNILVAPNRFGKSSIATAFASIAFGGINLSEDDAHNNDLANLPRVEIELTDGSHADELQPQCMEIWQLAEVSCNCNNDMLLHVFEDIIIEEPQIFYSHSDHLGSANWITDMTGTPVQYIHYMPYGEQLVYQTLTDYDERFKFTGKEHDDETGYDFFGARYHASALPSWLSVDPLADKYPGISPYAYCNWNPIKYVDPDGREKIIALSRADSRTPFIKSAALKFPDNKQVIHLWAHGNSNGVEIGSPDYDDVSSISSPEVFYGFLMNQSKIWQSREEKEATILVLHSCSTGSGNNSFAEQISSSPLFENVIIVAPSTDIIIIDEQEYGPADKENTNNIGLWNMFLNGKLVNSFNGTTAPIFSEPAKHLDKYKSETE